MLIIEYTPVDHDDPVLHRCGRCGSVVSVAHLERHSIREHGAMGYRIRPQSEDIA